MARGLFVRVAARESEPSTLGLGESFKGLGWDTHLALPQADPPNPSVSASSFCKPSILASHILEPLISFHCPSQVTCVPHLSTAKLLFPSLSLLTSLMSGPGALTTHPSSPVSAALRHD